MCCVAIRLGIARVGNDQLCTPLCSLLYPQPEYRCFFSQVPGHHEYRAALTQVREVGTLPNTYLGDQVTTRHI